MRNFGKILLAGTSPIVLILAAGPGLAQSTGTQAIETVTVTARVENSNGLMNAKPVSKEQSVVTSEFLQTQAAGQTVFQALNFMPGVNFTNNDPYGSSGGNIRMHGQDGNHVSLTFDGMPLNDTGNYAIYTNQMPDPEIVDRISASQGSTDVDSPTAAATGGVIAIVSDKPHDIFGGEAVISNGSFNEQRYFARIDSGEIGPWATKVYGTLSYASNDKFKGFGYQRKIQANMKLYQDMGATGWFSLAGHWNANRNYSYYAVDYVPNTTNFSGTLAQTADVIKNPNGSGYIGNPLFNNTTATLNSTGLDRDFAPSCAFNRTGSNNNAGTVTGSPLAGRTDYTMTTCSFWYRPRINPSDTGNVRFQSLWHLTQDLTLTADANLQYVLATGGSTFFTFPESVAAAGTNASTANTARQLVGGSKGGTGTTTSAFGCIPGTGCDLNGDGDVLDTVGLYQPSVTNTRRWGFNTSMIYAIDDDNTVQAAYTLDYGLHRQTGAASFVDPLDGPYTAFGALTDPAHAVVGPDGAALRFRDRKSKAILNQAAFDYEGHYFEDALRASLGFRLPFLERDLNQYCYTQAGSSTAYCTTAVPTITNTDGTVSFTGNTNHYAVPNHITKRYNRFLPHLGLTYLPFGDEHQFFGSYTQEIAAPRTDNLYQSQKDANGNYSTFLNTRPETSTTYQLGYRYLTEALQGSVVLWNSQVKNRIVSSFDQITNAYFDHNVPGINFWGMDFEANYKATDELTLYANAGYDRARITSNIPVGGGAAATYNKQLSEVPKWTASGRADYRFTDYLRAGIESKYVGGRPQTEDNNAFVPDYYTVGLDVTFALDMFGLPNSSLRFNADNLLNKHYFSSLGTQTCWQPVSGFNGCTSYPTAYVGSPQSFQVTLTARY